MGHKKPRGHSNIYANETEPYKDSPSVACIPISGGVQVHTCKPLPPLALRKEEWEEIGRKMGWIAVDKEPAIKEPEGNAGDSLGLLRKKVNELENELVSAKDLLVEAKEDREACEARRDEYKDESDEKDATIDELKEELEYRTAKLQEATSRLGELLHEREQQDPLLVRARQMCRELDIKTKRGRTNA